MKESKKIFKSLGITGVALCALCCALPIIGALLGIGTLSILANYFEWAGIAALILALLFFGVQFMRKKKAPACEIDCSCAEADNNLSKTKES